MARLIFALAIATCCRAQIPSTASVSGSVTDAITGKPIEGVTVTAGPKGAQAHTARTDANGHYSFQNLGRVAIYVSPVRRGYLRPEPHSALVNLATVDAASHDFVLWPASTLNGTVIDSVTGDPIANCRVSAYRRIRSMGEYWLIRAGDSNANDQTGRFEITDLEPGEYVLGVSNVNLEQINSGHHDRKQCHGMIFYPDSTSPEDAAPITVAIADTLTLKLRLANQKLRSLSGTLLLPEDYRGKAMMIAIQRRNYKGEWTWVAGGNEPAGRFHVENLQTGEYRLSATDQRSPRVPGPKWDEPNSERYLHSFICEQIITVGDHDIADVVLAPHPIEPVTIRATVRTDDGGKQPSNVQLILYSLDGADSLHSELSQGPFEVKVPSGEYWSTLRGLPLGYGTTQLLVDGKDSLSHPLLATESTQHVLTFVVSSKLGKVTGVSHGSSGTFPHYPSAGGSVVLVREPVADRVNVVTEIIAHVDQEGEFTFNDISPGTYKIIDLDEEQVRLYNDSRYLHQRAIGAKSIDVKVGETTHVILSSQKQ